MALYQKGQPMMGKAIGGGPDPFKARNLGGRGSSIEPTVKKAKVYDGRTGELIQDEGRFTPQEIAQGAGTFPGGIHIQPGTGSGSPNARIGNPGGVMAPPSPNALEANGRPGMGSLTDFYAANTADPVTGMALKPSAHEQLQTRAANEQGGVAGFQRQGALDAYYRAQQAGDPFSAAGARQALLEMRALQNAMGLQKPATDASLKSAGEGMFAPQMVAAALGMSNPALGAISQMQGFLPKREMGGPVMGSIPGSAGFLGGGPDLPGYEGGIPSHTRWAAQYKENAMMPGRALADASQAVANARTMGLAEIERRKAEEIYNQTVPQVPQTFLGGAFSQTGVQSRAGGGPVIGADSNNTVSRVTPGNPVAVPGTNGQGLVIATNTGGVESTLISPRAAGGDVEGSGILAFKKKIETDPEWQAKAAGNTPLAGALNAIKNNIFPTMAKGGHAKSFNPYMVGEVGPEVYVPEHGKPEVVGAAGPEIRTFKEDGEIIPNHEIKAAADGANVKKTSPREPESRWHFFKDSFGKSPIGREFLGLQNWAEQPFSWENKLARVFSPANKYGLGMLDPNWETNTSLPQGVQRTKDLAPTAPIVPAVNPMAYAVSQDPRYPDPYDFMAIRGGLLHEIPVRTQAGALLDNAQLATRDAAMTTPVVHSWEQSPIGQQIQQSAFIRDRMSNLPGVRSLSQSTDADQAFLTPYGKVGVSYGQPKKEGAFEGLPASEWFQRAANRQGDENKYAKVENGYETVAQKKERERSNLKKAGVL